MKGRADIAAIRETIQSTGEVRFHLRHSRRNLTVTCRMWHWDGYVLGHASGGGYDKAGAALGEAIERLFREELKGLTPGAAYTKHQGIQVEGGLYGLTKLADGRMSLDGSCGLERMLKVLEALGYKVDRFETGPASTMILGRRA